MKDLEILEKMLSALLSARMAKQEMNELEEDYQVYGDETCSITYNEKVREIKRLADQL